MKALPVNREEIKAFYIACGGSALETAKEFGLKSGVIRQWVRRYQWPSVTNSNKKIQEARNDLKSLERGSGVNVTHITASDALESLMVRKKGETQTALAVAVSNASEAAAGLDGLSALEASRKIKDLADTMSKLWPNQVDQAHLQVNILGFNLESLATKPVINI
jgi:hypothetical protein